MTPGSAALICDADGNPVGNLTLTTMATNPEYTTIRSEGWMAPDPSWSQQHGGHEHRWDIDGDERKRAAVTGAHPEHRHEPCNGLCGGVCGGEGSDVQVWVCDIYATVLRPGRRHTGPITKMLHRYTDWEIEVAGTHGFPLELDGHQVRWEHEDGKVGYVLLPRMRQRDQTIERGELTAATYTGRATTE